MSYFFLIRQPTVLLLIPLFLTLQPYMGFGLLHHIIPGFSIFDNFVPISQFQFLSIIYHFISPSILWSSFGSYSIQFQSVIFLASFISSILLRCPHHCTLCAFIYLTIYSSFINFCNSLFLITHPSLDLTGPFFLNICLPEANIIYFPCRQWLCMV